MSSFTMNMAKSKASFLFLLALEMERPMVLPNGSPAAGALGHHEDAIVDLGSVLGQVAQQPRIPAGTWRHPQAEGLGVSLEIEASTLYL